MIGEDYWISGKDLKELLKHEHTLTVRLQSRIQTKSGEWQEIGPPTGETATGLTGGVSYARDMDGICLYHICEGDEDGCENGRVRVLKESEVDLLRNDHLFNIALLKFLRTSWWGRRLMSKFLNKPGGWKGGASK